MLRRIPKQASGNIARSQTKPGYTTPAQEVVEVDEAGGAVPLHHEGLRRAALHPGQGVGGPAKGAGGRGGRGSAGPFRARSG